MNMLDIIIKKRDGGKLSGEEIRYFVSGYATGSIPDYQASAFLMAVFFSKMDDEETFYLTDAMKNSGDVMDLSAIPGIKIDKHSTGGVGDKTTLIATPIAAACGVPIAKMSGRSLGFTGGTIDKLESIPGFNTALDPAYIVAQVEAVGMAVAGQSASLDKADKLLYALRDVTGTVDNKSLIASSIMSKKLAAGSDGILLDVKCGKGAFMHNEKDAEELAELMVEIGRRAGKRTVAVISGMDQPLGRAVGNSAEVVEAIETLKGRGPVDTTQLSLYLAALMVLMGEKAATMEEARDMVINALDSGRALEKFKYFITAQEGDAYCVDHVSQLPRPRVALDVTAPTSGYVVDLDAVRIGDASQKAGAGRMTKEDTVDLSAGIFLFKKVGEQVHAGETIARVFGRNGEKVNNAVLLVQQAYSIGPVKPEASSLIKKTIGL